MSTVEFTVLGGGTEIGANSYFVSGADTGIILDCGLHPKKEGRDALPDLRAVLEAEDAPPLVKAQAAEAASRLGDHQEARLIFGAFTVNTGAVLQTQCLVSICRAMEDGPHVHQVFEEEVRKPGVRTRDPSNEQRA